MSNNRWIISKHKFHEHQTHAGMEKELARLKSAFPGVPFRVYRIKRAIKASDEGPVVSIKPMPLSGGRTDYFVSIKVGDKEVTPHVFREEYKAAYHVALYDWLLNGVGDEPVVVAFGPDDWPAQVFRMDHSAAASAAEAICDYTDVNLTKFDGCDLDPTKARELYEAAKRLRDLLVGVAAAPQPVSA
jgi:hypothetical protein